MDSVFYIVIAAMALIVVLLRFKVMMGISILCGGLLFGYSNQDLSLIFWEAAPSSQNPKKLGLDICLYFVMCLEVELRTSGLSLRSGENFQKYFLQQ